MYLPLWMVIVIGVFVAALVALRWELTDLLFDRVGCRTLDVWPQPGVPKVEPAATDGEHG